MIFVQLHQPVLGLVVIETAAFLGLANTEQRLVLRDRHQREERLRGQEFAGFVIRWHAVDCSRALDGVETPGFHGCLYEKVQEAPVSLTQECDKGATVRVDQRLVPLAHLAHVGRHLDLDDREVTLPFMHDAIPLDAPTRQIRERDHAALAAQVGPRLSEPRHQIVHRVHCRRVSGIRRLSERRPKVVRYCRFSGGTADRERQACQDGAGVGVHHVVAPEQFRHLFQRNPAETVSRSQVLLPRRPHNHVPVALGEKPRALFGLELMQDDIVRIGPGEAAEKTLPRTTVYASIVALGRLHGGPDLHAADITGLGLRLREQLHPSVPNSEQEPEDAKLRLIDDGLVRTERGPRIASERESNDGEKPARSMRER